MKCIGLTSVIDPPTGCPEQGVGDRMGMLEESLCKKRSGLLPCRHSCYQMVLMDPSQGTTESLSQNGGTSGNVYSRNCRKCWMEWEGWNMTEWETAEGTPRWEERKKVLRATEQRIPCSPWSKLFLMGTTWKACTRADFFSWRKLQTLGTAHARAVKKRKKQQRNLYVPTITSHHSSCGSWWRVG